MTGSLQIVERMRWMSALIAAAAGSSAPLDPRIAALAARHPGTNVQAIVQFNAPVTPAQEQSDATKVHGRLIGNLPIIHGLALSLTAAQARSLAASPGVHAVSLNTTVTTESLPFHMTGAESLSAGRLQTTYDQTLGVLPLWRFGVTGTGVGVAVVDTGVDGALADFATKTTVAHGSLGALWLTLMPPPRLTVTVTVRMWPGSLPATATIAARGIPCTGSTSASRRMPT